MPVCIVKGCTNRSSVKSRQQEEFEKTMKITLHAFPKCPTKRQLWLNSLGLQNSVVPKYPAVCSVHFRHEDLDRTSLVCVRLKENAIPYVKLPEIREENINAYKEISTDEPSTSACSDSYNTSFAVIKLETDDSVGFTEPMSIAGGMRRHLVNTGSHDVSEEVLKIESEFKNEHVGAILQSNKSTEAKVSSVDKCTCISPTRLFNSPTKQMLREHISKMKRRHQLELKAVRETNRRKDRKITDLQTRLQTLKKKNFLEEESKSIPSQVLRFVSENNKYRQDALFKIEQISSILSLEQRSDSIMLTICWYCTLAGCARYLLAARRAWLTGLVLCRLSSSIDYKEIYNLHFHLLL